MLRRRSGAAAGGCGRVAALLLLLAALAAAPAAAMFEDQAGAFDWHRAHVGRVTAAGYAPGRGRFYAATAQGLLAALSAADGSIAWRRAHPAAEDPLGPAVLLAKPSVVVAASSGGRYVRAWDAADGSLRWEAAVAAPAGAGAGSAAGAALAPVALADGGAGVAVVAGSVVQVIGAAKGAVAWSAELGSGGPGAVKLVAASGASVLAASFAAGSSTVQAAAFALADGAEAGRWDLPSPQPLGPQAALSGPALAALSEDGLSLCAARLEGAPGGLACGELRLLLGTGIQGGGGAPRLAAAGEGAFFVTLPSAGVFLVTVTGEGPRLAAAWAGATAASAPYAAAAGAWEAVVFGPASEDGARVATTTVDAATGEALATSSIPVPPSPHPVHGPTPAVTAAFPAASPGPGGAGGRPAALLTVWSDDTLALARGDVIAWSREEALASVTSTLFVDLPAAKGAAAGADSSAAGGAGRGSTSEGGFGGLVAEGTKKWVRMQALSVMTQLKLGSEDDVTELLRLREELSDKNLMYRDPNGFRKLIVVLTAPGKALALHNGDGRVIWAARYDSSAPPTHLLRWRRFHDLAHAPQLLLARAAGRDGGDAYASVLDGGTGRELERIDLSYPVDKVVPLPEPLVDGSSEQFCYALVSAPPRPAGDHDHHHHGHDHDNDHGHEDAGADESGPPASLPAHLLPGGPAARAHLAAAAPALTFWRAEAEGEGRALAGYAFDKGDAAGDGPLAARLAWSVTPAGRVLALAAREPSEPMHSAVKVLGDHSLKFKYTNPNVLFAAVASGGGTGSGRRQQRANITAMLISADDGTVLYQQVHEAALGPVQAVASEHWVVYTFLDAKTARQQATIVEMYDATPRDLSLGTVASAALGGGANKAVGATACDSATPLAVLTQSFYFQVRAKALSVTQTLLGINLKQLLIGTVTDQVYAMDVRFLDPRRPLRAKATPQEQEERLLPYSELLPFAPSSYATQDKAVVGLRGIASAPAGLESTTLVLAYGADLFYTRLAPARHFDSLADDFNYGLLVVGLAAVAIGAAVARRYSKETALQAAWK